MGSYTENELGSLTLTAGEKMAGNQIFDPNEIFPRSRRKVFKNVLLERTVQDGKWGEQNHDPFTWLSILGEEVGEAHQAAIEAKFPKSNNDGQSVTLYNLRQELIQVAAVAISICESLDRNELK